MVRYFVAGASGLLGTTLVPMLRAAGHDVVAHGNRAGQDVAGDLTEAGTAARLLGECRPDVVVNLVAHTNVDRCEEAPHEAYLLNARVVEEIVAAALPGSAQDARGTSGITGRVPGFHLVHISTDQVYDGPGPHAEHAVHIVNTYALSKYAGELAALRAGATVLRTNFFGRSRLAGRPSFSDWLVAKFTAGEAFTGFEDVYFNPLSMLTLSRMIERAGEVRRPGVYNVGARTGLSKAEFGAVLARMLGLDASAMCRVSVDTVKLKARRPKDMRMTVDRFADTFGVGLPTLEDEIQSIGDRA